MLTNIDINKMNHLLETNEDARQIITQLLKNHQEAVSLSLTKYRIHLLYFIPLYR